MPGAADCTDAGGASADLPVEGGRWIYEVPLDGTGGAGVWGTRGIYCAVLYVCPKPGGGIWTGARKSAIGTALAFRLIGGCKMHTMSCNLYVRPAVYLLSLLYFLISAFYLLRYRADGGAA